MRAAALQGEINQDFGADGIGRCHVRVARCVVLERIGCSGIATGKSWPDKIQTLMFSQR
jgi:hypothetical protein